MCLVIFCAIVIFHIPKKCMRMEVLFPQMIQLMIMKIVLLVAIANKQPVQLMIDNPADSLIFWMIAMQLESVKSA